jgi:Flp pilus assembly protein TadD
MTTAPPALITRTRVLLALGLVGVAVLGAGAWFYFRDADQIPTPPEAPDRAEPVVRRAVDKARKAVLESPRSGAAWGALTETFLANELEAEAVVCARVASKLDPDNPRWPYFLGGVLFKWGDKEGAAVQFRLAAERAEAFGDILPPLLSLAESLLATGDLDGAEAALRRALAARRNDHRALFDSGLLAVARGKDDVAETYFRRCLDSPFTRKKARDQLAVIRQRAGDEPGASELQSEAERMPPDEGWEDEYLNDARRRAVQRNIVMRRFEALARQGRFLDAARSLDSLVESAPDDDLVWLAMGQALMDAGQEGPAEQALRRALRLAPGRFRTSHYLGMYLLKQGGRLAARGDDAGAKKCFEEGATHCRRVLQKKLDHSGAHQTLGLLLNKLGQKDEACQEFRRAVQCSPEQGVYHYRLGVALDETDKADEACARLKRALELAKPGVPWVPDARARLARLSGKSGGTR